MLHSVIKLHAHIRRGNSRYFLCTLKQYSLYIQFFDRNFRCIILSLLYKQRYIEYLRNTIYSADMYGEMVLTFQIQALVLDISVFADRVQSVIPHMIMHHYKVRFLMYFSVFLNLVADQPDFSSTHNYLYHCGNSRLTLPTIMLG